MKSYKAILYDIDGTILNTMEMNMVPLQRIIKEETGEDWDYKDVLRFVPYPGMKVMEELGVKEPEKTYARWVSYVNSYEKGAVLYDGFMEVFQSFHGKMKQAIVSAKRKKQYEIDFVSKGLDTFMDVAVLAEDTTKHKPDAQPILLCLKKLGLKKEEVIYIGDAKSDYECCLRAGVDFGYAVWGSVDNKGITNPTYIFHQPKDLLKLLNKEENEL